MPAGKIEFDLNLYLPYRLTVLANALSVEMARQYKTKFGISMAEWRVLLNVGYANAPSIRDIQKNASLEKSKVSRAASRLEANGFVTKHVDKNDKRLLKMALTNEGQALLDQLIPIAKAFQSELDARIGEDGDALFAALDRLSQTAKAG